MSGLPRIEVTIEPIATDEDHDAWLRLFANRNEVAEEYAVLVRRNGMQWDGYAKINQAIVRRWSMAGLKYVKDRAWKIATGNL